MIHEITYRINDKLNSFIIKYNKIRYFLKLHESLIIHKRINLVKCLWLN